MLIIVQILKFFLLLGWLITPDSRPDFNDVYNRLNNMLSDPGRYILTAVSKLLICVSSTRAVF